MPLIDNVLNNYLQNLYHMQEGKLGKIQKQAYEQNIPIIKKDVISFLAVLLSIKKPKYILEIGCAVGFSAIFMSNYLDKEGKIITIERNPSMIQEAKQNLKDLCLEDKIILLEGDANDILKNLDEKFDIIFMDAAKGQYINILPFIYKMLNKEGLIIADDVLQKGTIAKQKQDIEKRQRTIHYRLNNFLKEITENKNLQTTVLPIGDGVSISYNKN